ncbi:MAG: hypothetical protein IDH49_04385 [Gammaproteobacteria bacterium]|nr:hypothetical protein [Gammaproteobacteria bacterium]
MKRTIVVLGVSLMVLACRDTTTQAPVNGKPPTVEYSQKTSADVAKYTNADWLYQNYFGEFNLPPSFKEQISVELKMVANGFALTAAQGGDVAQKIAFADTTVRQLFGTRDMMERMAGIASAAPENAQPPLPQVPAPATGTDDTQAAEEFRRMRAARTEEPSPDFAAYKEAQKQLVEQYKLPYDLPGSTTKVLHIEDLVTMKGDGGKRRPPKKPGNNSPRTHGAVDRWNWGDADMIMARGGGDSSLFDTNIYGHWGHAGIYNRSIHRIIDAFPNIGVRQTDWSWWDGVYHRI